jgi:hypothetical protein
VRDVSSSILLLAGVFLFTLGTNGRREFVLFSAIAGGVLMILGLVFWMRAMFGK